MPHLHVFDVSQSGHRMALRQSRGVFHVATTPEDGPQVDAVVAAKSATFGPGRLRDVSSGRTFNVVFETIGCDLQSAILHLEE